MGPRLPELIRRRPARDLVWRYRTASSGCPAEAARRIDLALRAAGARAEPPADDATAVTARLPWMTLVFGVLPRTVLESVRITLSPGPGQPWLEVRCDASRTHDAHAVGVAVVLAVAAAVWVALGPVRGLMPGATTLVGGCLWCDLTRRGAFVVLDRRLARLTDDLGRAVWPSGSGHVERVESI